jgi:hypothetical protein
MMMRRFVLLSTALAFLTLPQSHADAAVQPALPHGKSAHDASQLIPKLPPVMTTYDVYVGGLHFLTANILFQEEDGKYTTHVHAKTYGYLYHFLKWDGDIASVGKIEGDHFMPVSYRNLDTWKDKPKTTELKFDPKGNIKTEFDPPNNDQNRNEVTPEQKRGALDPATALLQMLAHVAMDKSCTLKVPVFDGKRRYDLNGEDQGVEQVDESEYGTYSGPARLCDVGFSMVAGEWKDREKNKFWEKQNGEAGRDAFHIYLASVAPNLPELPVRLESDSAWGTIMVHMSNWHYATSAETKS